jgi:hypothetical protein
MNNAIVPDNDPECNRRETIRMKNSSPPWPASDAQARRLTALMNTTDRLTVGAVCGAYIEQMARNPCDFNGFTSATDGQELAACGIQERFDPADLPHKTRYAPCINGEILL